MNINLPNELSESGYKSEERSAINKIIRAIKRVQLIDSNDISLDVGVNGTSVSIKGSNNKSQEDPVWG